MEKEVPKKLWSKKKKITVSIILIVVALSLIGISYAYWRYTISQLGVNRLSSTCLELSLTKEENAINLQNAYPIVDEEGKNLTPYSFTVENTCDMFASYTITLEILNESTLSADYVATMLNSNAITTLSDLESTTVSDASIYKEAYILGTESLGTGDREDYALRLWIDGDVTVEDDAMNKTFQAKVVITATPSTYSPVENGITNLRDAILANEYQTTDVQVSIEKINSKQTPDFTKTAPIIDWQETSTTSTANTANWTVARKEDVGSDLDYASNLTANSAVVAFSNTYTFDSEMGRYYLGDLIYQDPSTIDFSNGNYYTCGSGTNVSSTGKLSVYHNTNCTTMYKIGSLTNTEEITTSGSDGTTYPVTRYTFQRAETFTQVELESDRSDKGLYAATDDYGTSYYYRGSVNNNYVYFAGYYWRIIRINGDGSVRLLYAGTTPDATGNNLLSGWSTFNTQRNLPLYVGYMYGNTSGTTLEEVNANTNDSNIKSYLETWYQEHLSSYTDYIADSGFCNDRSLSTRNNNGDGVNTDKTTYYSANGRYYSNYNPTLICPDATNDLFTVTNELGNQASTSPIGLITIDELMYAGYRKDYINKLAYPFSGSNYWTMSPSHFGYDDAAAREFILYSDGLAYGGWVKDAFGVRPVINLNSDVQISEGIGTKSEPFIVKTI